MKTRVLAYGLIAVILGMLGTASVQADDTTCTPPPTCGSHQASRWNGSGWSCVNMAFGGIYMLGVGCDADACRYGNPFTGSCSCPNGYTPVQFWEYYTAAGDYADGCTTPDFKHYVRLFQCIAQ